jgi:hypothetical protein
MIRTPIPSPAALPAVGLALPLSRGRGVILRGFVVKGTLFLLRERVGVRVL